MLRYKTLFVNATLFNLTILKDPFNKFCFLKEKKIIQMGQKDFLKWNLMTQQVRAELLQLTLIEMETDFSLGTLWAES